MRIPPLEPHVPGKPGQTLTQMKVLYAVLAVVGALFACALFGGVLTALQLEPWRWW